jgi:hypothetical protein
MALYANMFNSQAEKIPMKYFGVLEYWLEFPRY